MFLVPIYLGAPNIKEFDPLYEEGPNGTKNLDFKPKSFINVADFADAKALSDYLQVVASNETLYNTFLEWKNYPPTPRFKQLADMSLDFSDTACRICQYVAKERVNKRKKS